MTGPPVLSEGVRKVELTDRAKRRPIGWLDIRTGGRSVSYSRIARISQLGAIQACDNRRQPDRWVEFARALRLVRKRVRRQAFADVALGALFPRERAGGGTGLHPLDQAGVR